MLVRLLALSLALCVAADAGAQSTRDSEKAVAASGGKTVRLLTVGNSFSRNATAFLEELATAGGNVLVHHQAYIGGSTMSQHYEKLQQNQRDPQDNRGLYPTGRSLRQELQAEPWDFVTIQQASIRSHDVSTYRPYARQLYDAIKRDAPRAEVLLHETWAYRRDDPRFSAVAKRPAEPATQEAMYRGLRIAYQTIAGELGVRLIPVGDAFYLADTDPTWGYQPDAMFDYQKARQPALPNQTHSLHVGWRWLKQRDGKFALQMDGHHANVAGEYLGGCVFYEVLFGQSVVDNPFVPRGLDADYARFLRQTAHRAVANERARQGKPAHLGSAKAVDTQRLAAKAKMDAQDKGHFLCSLRPGPAMLVTPAGRA